MSHTQRGISSSGIRQRRTARSTQRNRSNQQASLFSHTDSYTKKSFFDSGGNKMTDRNNYGSLEDTGTEHVGVPLREVVKTHTEKPPGARRRMLQSGEQELSVLTNLFHREQNKPTKQPMQEVTVRVNNRKPEHSFVYKMLSSHSKEWYAIFFKRFIAAVIMCDMICFVVSTEPRFRGHEFFYYAEGVTSSIFLAEYLARFITCTERHSYHKRGPVFGRLIFALTGAALIDALATFPFFVELLTGFALPTLTYLRVFRLFRIAKTEGYSKAMSAVVRVLFYNREILYVALLVCIMMVVTTAVLMYYLRPPNPGEGDSDFESIAATMYLSTLMLTGQGGPTGDLPWYTKAVVLLTGFFSVAMFAIPASMLTWGFEAEAARLAMRARRRKRGWSSSSSSSSAFTGYGEDDSSDSVNTSDEEYQRIIAGEEESDERDDADGEKALMREMLQMFQLADKDASGTLTREEFLKIMKKSIATTSSSAKPTNTHSFIGANQGTTNAMAHLARAAKHGREDRIEELEAKLNVTIAKLDRLMDMMAEGKQSSRWGKKK